MLGVRTSQVFASRWKALIWAASVMLTAYCTIPAADDAGPQASAATTKPGQPSDEEKQARMIIKRLNDLNKK